MIIDNLFNDIEIEDNKKPFFFTSKQLKVVCILFPIPFSFSKLYHNHSIVLGTTYETAIYRYNVLIHSSNKHHDITIFFIFLSRKTVYDRKIYNVSLVIF